MSDVQESVKTVDSQLDEMAGSDPVGALAQIAAIRATLGDRERTAVRAAIAKHTWREIGAALGVSKQSAFQRFGKEWVVDMKTRAAAIGGKAVKDEVRHKLRD